MKMDRSNAFWRSRRRKLRLPQLKAELLESRFTPSAALPGMQLLDAETAALAGQVFYLDFDGAGDVTYEGPVAIEGIDVPTFRLPEGVADDRVAVIAEVTESLNKTFAGTGMVFTATQPAGGLFSTIYVGGDGAAFAGHGELVGVAERVDSGNANRGDKAFVFSERIGAAGFAASLSAAIAHEAGHLVGWAQAVSAGSGPLASVAVDYGDPPAAMPGGAIKWWEIWPNPFGDSNTGHAADYGTEVDYLAYMPEGTGNYTISTSSGAVDTMLRIYNSNGDAITGIIDSNRGTAGESTVQAFTSHEWYYIGVAGYQFQTGAYSVTVNGPNCSTVVVATPAPNYSGSYNASINPTGTRDFFSITAPAGTATLDVSVTPSAGLDTAADLYNSAGTWLRRMNTVGNGATDFANAIPITPGATYYVGISNASDNHPPTATGTYRLDVDFDLPAEDAYEENDSKTITDGRPSGGVNSPNLGALTTAKVIHGLALVDAGDWYKFSMAGSGGAGDYVQIDFTHSDGDLDLAVYRSDGTTLVGAGTTSGNFEKVSLNGQPAGTYYVKVYGYNGAFNAGYKLTIDPGVAPPSDDAYEDNDAKSVTDGRAEGGTNSPNLGLLGAQKVIGSLKLMDTADWYRFRMGGTGTTADFVKIDFTHSQGDLDLVVYASNGTTVVGSSTGSGNSETVGLNGVAAGTYYARVYGYNGATNPNYTLTVDPGTATDDAYEDNDSKAITDARPIGGANSPNLGTLSAPRVLSALKLMDGRDMYRFEMSGTGTVADYVQIDFTHSQGDLVLDVFRSDGTTLVGHSDGTGNTERVSLNGQAPGTYYVKVWGAGGAYNANYTLTIDPAVPPPSDDAYEDNDSKAITDGRTAGAANSPNLGTITTRQIISGLKMLDGADWYKFSMNGAGTASDFVRAEFTQSQGDLDLVVYKSDGTTVVGSSTGSTSTEQVNLTGQPAGTYYAKVYGHNGATNPGYTLTIDPAAPTLSDDAYEDNDSKAITDARPAGGVNSPNLGTLTTTKTINTLAMSDSADWYKFQMNGLGYSTHYVRLNFTHSQGDLDLYVYKSDGVTLVGSSAGKTGTEQVGLNAQPAGTYYVKVMGASGAYNPNYSLLINPSAIGDDVYEDNDSRAITDGRPQGGVNSPNLGLLTAKRVISGLALADSNDYFKFRMDGAGTTADYVRIDYDYSQGNIDFALWRADGSLVRGSETANNYEEISLNGLPAGTYYVNAYRWSAINNPNYTLTIDPGTPPAANAQNYVVLFAGGFDAANNHSRYYNNIKGMYQKIAGFGLVPRNNIYVLYADGTGAAVDQNTGSGQINSDMSFAYQSTVLAGTKENLQSVMNTLSAKVDNDDNFLFYSFDHGGGTNNRPATTGEEQLTGWGNAIDDEVLAGWLRSINSGHSTYIFTQCFAGGMLDNLLPLRSNEFGAAATNHYEYSWGDGFAKAFLNGLSATSMTHAAYNSAYNNDPFSDKGSYPANGGTVANQIEHPWWAGANFRIFNPVGGSAPLPDEGRALETAFEAQGAAGQSPDLMEPNSPDAPTVTHLTSDPVSPIIVGQIVTLDATVTGDSVASVGFYEDLDAQGDADANELIGTDYDSAGGWTCQWDTKLHATGAVTLLAVAENAGKEVSAPRSLAVTLTDPPVNHAPTVHTFTSNPVSPVVVGQQVTLTATATDPDAGDSVTSVSFYEDLDGQGDADANEWIGTDSDIAGGWSYQWDTKLHATGAVTLLAVAEDVAKMPSAPRTLAMTFNAPIVNHAPTVNTLVSNPLSPIAASQLVTLTATASDPDGGLGDYIAAVAFYDDRDGQGDGDPEELIGSDSISTDGWSVIWDTALRAPGVVTLLGIAEDSFKELSAPGLLAVTLLHVPVNQPPVVTGFQSAPATWLTVGYPATLTVFANDPDTGDQISHVYFFEDLNRNGVGDMATPWLEQIGQDFDGGDGWSSAWDTTGHATGAVQLLAVAYDSTNTLSAARVLNVTLAAAPTASLTGGVLTITGGAGPDHLRVERDPGNTAMLRVSDVGNGNATLGTFADSEVGSISATLGEGNDSISVDASITDAATLRGGTGDDSLLGGGGFDSLYGDLGNDSLTGGGAADSLNGGSGTDRVIDAGNGNLTLTNVLLNANGNDVLSGMEQAHVTAGVGNDTINASAFSGSVTMLGGAGNDSLIGGAGNDWMTGDAGSDSFVGNGGADRVVESADASFALTDSQLTGVGTDSLSGIEQADLTGGGSANTLNASAFTRGPVSLGGGGGNDQLLGSNAGDLLNGGDGNDSMAGNGGNDSLTGGNGNDTFSGGAGSDRLVELGDASYTLTDTALTGGLGTDSLGADIESASLTGGAGNNSFTVTGWTKPVTLNGGDGNDTVIASGDRNFTLTNPLLTRVGSTSVSLSSIEGASLTGGAGNNALNSSAFTLGSVTLDGGAGNDSLIGGPGGDSLFGGDGNDRLDAGLGNDSMDGGAGNDTFLEKPGSTDSIRDTFGSDVLDFSTALRGVTVNLSLQGVLQAADSLGNGLILDGVFESVLGSSFNDALTGTSGANYLAGNNGNDTLRGLGANDTLNGGGGTDRVSESGSFNFVLANTSLTGASSDVDTLIGIEQAELRGTNNDDLLDPRAFTLGPVTLDGADGNDTLFGTGLGDSLVGGADDDSLLGGNGHDTLFGGAGNNHLDGAAGTDRVFESGDADFTFTPSIVNALGTDSLFNIEQGEALGLGGANTFDITQWTRPTTLNGGAGTDRVVAQNDANFTLTNVLLTRSTGGAFALANIEEASFSAAAGDNIMNAAAFTAGPVTLAGGDGNDSLMGGSGADSLEGGNGNDSLNGGLGDDIVSGGAGNDTYAERPGSDDVINDTGGGTADLLDFTTATAGVTFDLSLTSGQVQVVDALGNTVAINGGIERLTGSNFNDSLLGTVGPETINGSGGNDTLAGLAGNDSMAGGAGTDVLAESGGPNLTLTNTGLTGLGTDTLSAVEQASLTGTGAADTLNASGFTGPVTLVGGAGNDALMGGAGNDVLNGGADNDSIVGGGGVNRVVESNASFVLTDSQLTGLGTDVLANVQQAWLIGTGANDALNAAAFTKGPVTLDGGLGNDTLTGGTLNDSLLGGGGDDSLLGGLGNDSLTGGAGNDSLDGGGGTGDRLIETGDVDFTLGASLLTGLGSDALTGIEQVSLSGGDSDNRFNVSGWILPGVTLNGGAGTDRVLSANDANMTLTNVALSRTTGGSFSLLGIEEAELTGGAGNNILNAGAFTLGPVALIGDAGNDTLTGGSGNDQLRGDGENDRLTGGNGHDTMDGGMGNDALFGGNGDDYLLGYDGIDTLSGDAGNDTLIDWDVPPIPLSAGGTGVNIIITAKTDPLLLGPTGIMAVHFPWAPFS